MNGEHEGLLPEDRQAMTETVESILARTSELVAVSSLDEQKLIGVHDMLGKLIVGLEVQRQRIEVLLRHDGDVTNA